MREFDEGRKRWTRTRIELDEDARSLEVKLIWTRKLGSWISYGIG